MKATVRMQLLAEQLELKYQRQPIWKIDQLFWSQGQSIWLQGKNGSGKTSLLKVLAGLQKPSRGRVHLQTTHTNPLEACCYLHQHPYMFNTSVRNNLKIAAQGQTAAKQNKATRITEALAWAQLESKADQAAQTLSGGERQRLALARAWLVQPRFWLLDEPTASLDTEAVEELAYLIQDLQKQGCGLLVTSHQDNPVTALCSEHWLLNNGSLKTS
ncbi:tungstate transport system ATP-binding protein [Marinospirillum celere]|uniref:Tungstate transport system ATP-binding protein n=1 Tax=Marinospirillum celere TaxID=1122252 RepID=A0A1I1JQP6_9GAMM|nr:ABC transporter ATP-binding protein [Marinospirillum celere]SFC50977.1 tungstate transport system ATP-binding protein [Marinospirillum celere]